MSQSIPSAALSAANALQRMVGLVFCGCAIGISYATLVIKPRTTNAKVLVWIHVARYLAVTSSVMTGLVALHMTGLSFESILGDFRLNVPEMGAYLAATLVVHQAYYAVMSYLLLLRLKSVLPPALNHARLVPVLLTLSLLMASVPTVCLITAASKHSKIQHFLTDVVYNRGFKISHAIQSAIIGATTIAVDLTLVHKIGATRAEVHKTDAHALGHLQRSMAIVIVDACVTLIEVSVRIAATMAPYIAVDTYLKGLNISVDIFTYCTLGVSINDVLRKSPSLSLSSYAATAVVGHTSGDNYGVGGGGEHRLVVPAQPVGAGGTTLAPSSSQNHGAGSGGVAGSWEGQASIGYPSASRIPLAKY